MKVKNTIDKDLTLQYAGDTYTIEAKESKDFPEDVAEKWFEIYGFLKEDTSTSKETKKAKEELEEKTDNKWLFT